MEFGTLLSTTRSIIIINMFGKSPSQMPEALQERMRTIFQARMCALLNKTDTVCGNQLKEISTLTTTENAKYKPYA